MTSFVSLRRVRGPPSPHFSEALPVTFTFIPPPEIKKPEPRPVMIASPQTCYFASIPLKIEANAPPANFHGQSNPVTASPARPEPVSVRDPVKPGPQNFRSPIAPVPQVDLSQQPTPPRTPKKTVSFAPSLEQGPVSWTPATLDERLIISPDVRPQVDRTPKSATKGGSTPERRKDLVQISPRKSPAVVDLAGEDDENQTAHSEDVPPFVLEDTEIVEVEPNSLDDVLCEFLQSEVPAEKGSHSFFLIHSSVRLAMFLQVLLRDAENDHSDEYNQTMTTGFQALETLVDLCGRENEETMTRPMVGQILLTLCTKAIKLLDGPGGKIHASVVNFLIV